MINKDSLQFIQAAPKGGRHIICGATGTGKTGLLLARYKYMTEELGIPGDSVLVLLSNGVRLRQWKKSAAFRIGSGMKCCTYNGFVQEELQTYYPFVTGSCNDICRKAIKPAFIGYEPSKYLISKAVQLRRERNGAFSGLTATPERAASELAGNLLAASAFGIPPDEIAFRLENALERKDSAKVSLLRDAGAIMEAYRMKCLELGIFDTSISTMLYSRYLLGNGVYRDMLCKRVKHVIADDLQDFSPVGIELLRTLYKAADTCAFSFNSELMSGSLKEHTASFAEELSQRGFEQLSLWQCHTCNERVYAFAGRLSALLNSDKCLEATNKDFSLIRETVERHPPCELRSDMLQQLGDRVITLIEDEGCSPSDIAILSTYADNATEAVLSSILKEKGYKLNNISKRSKIYDNPLCRAILAFTQLCHPELRLFPTRDDLRLMCSRLFKLDPVRCAILARRIFNAVPFPEFPGDSWLELENTLGTDNLEKYIYIKRWADAYKQQDGALPAGEFMYRALVEVFLSDDTDLEEAMEARKMTDMAIKFSQSVSGFGRNATRDFIDMARNQAVMPESMEEREDFTAAGHVILGTPASFASNSLSCRILVFCGLSSGNWLRGAVGELSNPYVLNSSWKQGTVYSDELDAKNRKIRLAQLLIPVIKRCSDRLVTFESSHSAGGFQNDGILSGLFDEILQPDE